MRHNAHYAKIAIFLPIFLFFFPQAGYLEQSDNVVRCKKMQLVQIKYGTREGEFGREEFEGGFFTAPKAFALDSNNNIYIADSVNPIPRVQVFNDKGKFLRKIDLQSKQKPLPVVDITINNNELYVMVGEDIQIYDLSGRRIHTIRYYQDFDVNKPWTDALYSPTRLEVDLKGNIFLSTRFGALAKLSPQGTLLEKWSNVDHYIDSDGNLFVMDLNKENRGKVAKFSVDGKRIMESVCDALFPSRSNSCRLPMYLDKQGNMYRIFKDLYVTKYTKQKSTLLAVDLYFDENGYYYKVDVDGNIYSIKDDLLKYSCVE